MNKILGWMGIGIFAFVILATLGSLIQQSQDLATSGEGFITGFLIGTLIIILVCVWGIRFLYKKIKKTN